jgi:DNA-binding MarR family transcriptional regulator
MAVVRNYHRCEAQLARRIAPLGMSITAHEVMLHLLHQPHLSQQALAHRVFTAKSHLSAVVRDLEARGLIKRERDASDARARTLTLTRSGKTQARRAHAIQSLLVAQMGEGVSEADMATFLAVALQTEQNLLALALDERPVRAEAGE